MRKRAILIVGVALLIAAAGLVYAHWTETLTVDTRVTTGNITTHWKTVYTDDDGGANPNDGEPVLSQAYTYLPATSNDPSGPSGTAGVDPHLTLTPPMRYGKDVADCIAGIDPGNAHGFILTVTNAYPSYYCTILSTLGNQGTVPVKVQALRTTVTLDGVPFVPTGQSAVGLPSEVASWWTIAGHDCGEQIDPGGFNTTIAAIHIGQLAPQSPLGVFVMHQEIDLVNWNEWNGTNCNVYFNGALVHTGSPW